MKKIFTLITFLILALITGCIKDNQTASVISETTERTEKLYQTSLQPARPRVLNQVTVTDDIYLGAKVIELVNGAPLPHRFEQENGITIYRKSPITLREITALIAKHTEIPVLITGSTGQLPNLVASPSNSIAEGPIPTGQTRTNILLQPHETLNSLALLIQSLILMP